MNSKDEVISPNKRSRREKVHKTVFVRSILKKESIQKRLLIKDSTALAKIDLISKREIFFFIIYAVIFMISAALQLGIGQNEVVFEALSKILMNKVRVGSEYKALDPQLIMLDDVHNFDDFTSYLPPILNTLFYPTGDPILLANGTLVDGFGYLKPFTAWRFVQKRVGKVPGINGIIDYKWDPNQKESTESYGFNTTYNYSEDDGGFVLYFDLPLYGSNTSAGTQLFTTALRTGYFDRFTKSLVLDAGFYSSALDRACYVRIAVTMGPTGYNHPTLENFCFPIVPYSTSAEIARGLFEIIFALLTGVYIFIEFLQIKASIRHENMIIEQSNANPDAKNDNTDAHRHASVAILYTQKLTKTTGSFLKGIISTLKGIILGLLSYIQNVWHFLDVFMIILMLIIIIVWGSFVDKAEIKGILDQLNIQPGQIVVNNDNELQIFRSLNRALSGVMDSMNLYYRCVALAGAIIIIKMLKYLTGLFDPLKQILTLIVRVLLRILPFVVLLFTILIAFALLGYFYYGSLLQPFSSADKALFYTFQNILQNYDSLEDMLDVNFAFTFCYVIVFSFVVIFIMTKVFLIYIVAEYRKFSRTRRLQQEIHLKNAKTKKSMHILSRIYRFFIDHVYMRYLKIFRKKRFADLKHEEEIVRYETSQDAIRNDKYEVNASIEATIQESQKKIRNFSNDVLKERSRQRDIKHFVVNFWGTVGIIFILIILCVISMARHDIYDSHAFNSGIKSLIAQLGVNPILNRQNTTDLDYLDSVHALRNWINFTFPFLMVPQRKTITDDWGDSYDMQGYFINEYFYVVNSEIAFTVRRKAALNFDRNEDLAKYCNVTMPEHFAWNAPANQTNEFAGTLIGATTNSTYNYIEEKPGYFFVFHLETFREELAVLIDDGIIDGSLNSIMFEFALYHVPHQLPVYVQGILTVDLAGNIVNEVKTIMLNTPTTDDVPPGSEITIYILNGIVVLIALIYTYKIIRAIRKKNEMYSHWYEIYVDHFSEITKRKRFEAKPELLRRIQFIFSGMGAKIAFVIFLQINLVLLFAEIAIQISIQKKYDSLIPSAIVTDSEPFPYETDDLVKQLQSADVLDWWLRLVDSITIIILTINLLMHYSFSPIFYIITKTLQRSLKDVLFAMVILTFVFCGFAFMMMCIIGIYNRDYTNVFSGFIRLLDATTGIGSFDMAVINTYNDAFFTIFFFYPYTIIGKLVLVNIFIGIVYDSYIRTKQEIASRNQREAISVVEFLKLTKDRIFKICKICKQHKLKKGLEIDLSTEFREGVNPNRVMEQFKENLIQAKNHKDIRIWSAHCSKDIITEYETRKKIRRKAKEIVSLHLEEDERTLAPTNFSNKPPESRIKEYQVREIYWSYFRIGVRKLMKLYDILSRQVKRSETKISDMKKEKIIEETVDKLKVYIAELEEKIETNMLNIQEIRKVFKQHDISDEDESSNE